jgi:hypothetical protein
MDPQVTWEELQEAFADGDWGRVEELSEALLDWLDRGGFPPRMCAGRVVGEDWDRVVSRAAAEFARDRARDAGP